MKEKSKILLNKPKIVLDTFRKWYTKKLGFERVNWKGKKLRCYFVSNPQSSFYETDHFNNLIGYVNSLGDRKMGFKQSAHYFLLVKDDCKTLKNAVGVLRKLSEGMRK